MKKVTFDKDPRSFMPVNWSAYVEDSWINWVRIRTDLADYFPLAYRSQFLNYLENLCGLSAVITASKHMVDKSVAVSIISFGINSFLATYVEKPKEYSWFTKIKSVTTSAYNAIYWVFSHKSMPKFNDLDELITFLRQPREYRI